jgi:hypothetical protein
MMKNIKVAKHKGTMKYNYKMKHGGMMKHGRVRRWVKLQLGTFL